MPALGNLVHETSTSTGTGDLTVSLVNGKQRISELLSSLGLGFGDNGGSNPILFISNRDAQEWEVVQCYLDDADTLVRSATPIDSSNGGDPVDFSAGTKDVTNAIPAQELRTEIDDGLVTGAVSLSEDYGSVA